MSTLTVYANANDGELDAIVDSNYASARAMTGATASTSITTSHVGQGYATDNETYWLYECWETFERFDTSSIGDSDTIDSVVYSSYLYNDASATDFTDEVRLSTWSVALDASDAVAGANLGSLTLLASKATLGIGAAGYKDFTSETAFATNVSKTGDTVIMRASSRQRLNNAPSGDENCIWYAADQTGTTYDPKLVVTHAAGGGLTAVSDTLVPTYAIRQLAADTIAPSYNVRQLASDTLVPAYALTQLAADQLVPSYDLRQLAADSLIPIYDIQSNLTAVSDTLAPVYALLQLAADTLSPTYDLRQLASDELAATYALLELAADSLAPAYAVRQLASDSLGPAYAIRQLAAETLVVTYILGASAARRPHPHIHRSGGGDLSWQ